MVTVDRDAVSELNGLVEDMVGYWCSTQAAEGKLVAGQTAWKLIAAYALAKELQMDGVID